MNYKIKLVKGMEDEVFTPVKTPFKKRDMLCKVSLSDNQIKKMKQKAGLVGNVSNEFIVQEFLKQFINHA
tara:strand:+ start:1069 stop:1278 length:210 start_codon:yes stop_codon:yes gene_type:complete